MTRTVEQVLHDVRTAKPVRITVIGQTAEGELYYVSTEDDGQQVLWDLEKAQKALLEA